MNIRILVAAGVVTLAGSLDAPANAQETFYGYDCTYNCSGQQATPTFMLSFVIRRVWRCNRARRAVANGTFDQPEALKK